MILIDSPTQSTIFVLGDDCQDGTYVLRILVQCDLKLKLGRSRKRPPVAVPAGDYLYVGSGMGSLGTRLMWHATKTAGKPPHGIRDEMISYFEQIGLNRRTDAKLDVKTLNYQVDFLIDQECVDLVAVYAIRSSEVLEPQLGYLLGMDPGTVVIEPGLGASDYYRRGAGKYRNNTHLLGVVADEGWWEALSEKMLSLLTASEASVDPAVP